MPIDSSIYQNIQVQPQYNALDQYAKQQQLQHVVGQNDLAQLLLQDKQREIQDAGEVRNFTRQSGGDPNKLKEALFGAGRYKEGMVIDEMLGKRRKEAADLSKLQSEAGSKRLQLYREAMPEIKTPEDAAGWVRSQYSDPHLSDIMASRGSLDQAIARIPQDPAGLTRWMQQNG
jgi:bacterioferritin (cytochrome b1)